jgi:biopolymer transport protein ExbD
MTFLRPKKLSLSLDMAPLIDIVFQLLIFFMLTFSFSAPSIHLELPKAVTSDKPKNENIVISLDKAGKIFVGTAPVEMAGLKNRLASELARKPASAVHLRGDAQMPYHYFVEVMDTARQAGARQIHIVHQEGNSR